MNSAPIPQILRPAPPRKRLWQGGLAVLLVVGTFVAGNLMIAPQRAVTRGMLGHDFLAFYTAGEMVRTGQADRMYDLRAIGDVQRRIAQDAGLSLNDAVAPFWNPPFFALPFAPLSALPFSAALGAWTVANLAAMVGAIVLLCRMLPGEPDWRTWALVPLLIVVSMPFIQVLSHGQNTMISLFLLVATVTAWRRQRDLAAGVFCGLLLYKPQLAAVLAVMLVLNRGRRALVGLGIAAGSLGVITVLVMPEAAGAYLRQLPANLHLIQVQSEYMWERHMTFAALWRLMLQGRESGEILAATRLLTIASSAVVVIGLIVMIIRDRRASADDVFTGETKFVRRDRLIAATIASTPLLMPFYFDYDLLLLAVPAVLLAGELLIRAPGHAFSRADRAVVGGFAALYLALMVNPGFGRLTGINVGVIVLTAIAAMLIRRACVTLQAGEFNLRQAEVIRVTARRAA